ncbi:hypothetical protein [Pseudanabaena mucicola]|uniref:O-antigen ligase domain-containing protein n=1 Tax=Pseudanabaena mucicola FACHB-723 TaxID=2692860 RepID=A0ABR7ZUC7_9CYAN|nr:hypothetical protein [Pseudanabaena mucicola]MBD2187085.1 hypothetical protein [Pseudanabaena mucicola FACHB-723]
MSDNIIIVLISLFILIAIISNWRNGTSIALYVGFLQESVRKIIPDQPVYLNLLIVVVIVLTFFSAITQLNQFNLSDTFQRNKNLINLFQIFIVFIFIQATNAFLRTNSPVVPTIGILAYLLPLLVIVLTYYYFRHPQNFEKLALTYVLINIVVACSVYLEWSDIVDWQILKPVGEALRITDSRVSGGFLISHAGLMRTSEVAAWHMGSSICATFLLFLVGSYKKISFMVLPVIMLLFSAGLLTGRRKFIVTVVTFLISYAILYLLSSISVSKKMSIQPLIVLMIVLLIGSISLSSILDTDIFDTYTTRGTVSVSDVQDRFSQLGLGSLQWALDRSNWLGFGAGIVSQGSQYVSGEDYSMLAGASEGGLGKIIIELGIPGLILCAVIVYMLIQYLWKTLISMHQADTRLGTLVNGILAFQIANFAVFTSAVQIYGDPFVLSIQGFCMGFALASWKFISHKTQPISQQISHKM